MIEAIDVRYPISLEVAEVEATLTAFLYSPRTNSIPYSIGTYCEVIPNYGYATKAGRMKVLEWSMRLHVVVARALARTNRNYYYLFSPTKRSVAYSRLEWGSSWKDVQLAWIQTIDGVVTESTLTVRPLYCNLLRQGSRQRPRP